VGLYSRRHAIAIDAGTRPFASFDAPLRLYETGEARNKWPHTAHFCPHVDCAYSLYQTEGSLCRICKIDVPLMKESPI